MRRRAFFTSTGAALAALATGRLDATPIPRAKIVLGNEVFLASAWHALRGRGVAVITNQTGVTSQLESVVDAIRRNPQIRLRAIFAPEHGFRGDRTAGAYVPSYRDPETGLPVYSLYGPTRHPSPAMLEGIDVLLFDIQDVGSRAYTFISTMAYAMQTAAAHDKEFWVLDRPNPVGSTVEGPVLDPQYASFIGLYPIAMRHGMTIGELARLFNERFGIGAKLRVIPMHGYTRAMIWPDTGLQWVQSSPNIPTWETCFPYLCTGLIDNAGVNNGVGTTNPFFYAGMAGLDAAELSRELNARNLPGVYFRPASWSPIAGFWHGKELSGVELAIFDYARFAAIRTAVEILVAVRTIAPHVIDVREPASLDRDWGTDKLRVGLLHDASAEAIIASLDDMLATFRAERERFLLY